VPVSRLLAGQDGTALAARLADVAHKLHRANAPAARPHGIAAELAILHERLHVVATDQPALGDRITELLRHCDHLGGTLSTLRRERHFTGIDRDYYPDQVLIDANSGRMYLLDLDMHCLGEPALDIGNCLAHITEQALRTTGDPLAFAANEHALRDRYAQLVSDETAAIAATAYAALSLARHIHISTLHGDRQAFTATLLHVSLGQLRQAAVALQIGR
jgi:hypothetical protein